MMNPDPIQNVYCPSCNDDVLARPAETVRTATIRGREVTAPVNILHCPTGHELDDPNHDFMVPLYSAYRQAAGLLSPQDIQDIRRQYGLSQKAFARLLGMGEVTVARYETGSLQDEAHDNLIRACQQPTFVADRVQAHRDRLNDTQLHKVASALRAVIPACQLEPRNYDQSGGRDFEYTRFAAMTWLILKEGGPTTKTKLNKECFYADYQNFRNTGKSISGSRYQVMHHGPVPIDYEALLARMERDGLIQVAEKSFGEFVGSEASALERGAKLKSNLNPHERELIQRLARYFKAWTATKIANYSHEETAWKDRPTGEVIHYQKAHELRPLWQDL